ncbi:MAG: hypothetical protein ACYC5H_12275 [Methylovirgula sp.]
MRKPISWGARTTGNDVRDAARDAARREGMSLSEWLAQAVGQYAAETGVDPAQMDENDRLDAITGKLRRLGVPGLRQGERRSADDSRVRSDRDRGPTLAMDANLRSPRTATWPRGLSELPRDEVRLADQDSDALLARAAMRLGDNAEFGKLAHRLEHLEAELSQRTPQEAMQPIKGALARLEARLETLAQPAVQVPLSGHSSNGAAPMHYAEQLDRVESKVNSLLNALASSTAMPSAGRYAPTPSDSAPKHPSLGDAIAEIARRQRSLETPGGASPAEDHRNTGLRFGRAAGGRVAEEPVGSGAIVSLRNDIASLAGKVEDMRREQAARDALPPASCNLDKLRSEIATMSDALRDLAARGSLAPLEAAVRNLTQQIETSRTDGIREAVLRPLERLVGDLRHALAEVDPRTTIRGLEGEVQKLGNKLDDLGKRGFDVAALGTIDDRTREIRELLAAAPAHAAPVEKIEQQIAALNERFDRMRDNTERHEEGDLQAVADELRTLMREPGHSGLAKIEGQLDAITARVEEALAEARDDSRYTALANRINDVHHELSDRIARGMPQLDVQSLENLVRSLAERVDQARAPQADNRAIEALQQQVSEFAARWDRAEIGLPSLNSLEQSISDLFAELERTREISYTAAEQAARNVLQETLARTPADRSDLSRELVELRDMQDAAGRRTLATLNAVHETLEKVVDRLAMVETEIAEVRPQRAPELLASGAAPNFAPAAGREPPPFVAAKEAPASRAEGRSKGEPAGEKLEDFLIEPGRGLPGRRNPMGGEERKQAEASDLSDSLEATTGRAGFIAAARRAAQAAQMESAAAIGRPQGRGGFVAGDEDSAGIIEQTRNFIVQHKRPVVLSVAALFLAMGAYAVVKTVGHAPLIDLPINGGSKEAPAGHIAPPPAASEHKPQSRAPAVKPTASPTSPSATNSRPGKAKAALDALPGSDPVVTGAISPKPRVVQHVAAPSPSVFQSLAQAGDAKAQYEFANLYATGNGLPRDLKLAAHWYEKSAAQGLAPAQYRLGSLYEKGIGVKRSLAQATLWYRKAAEAGNIRAMHNLAVLTAEGGVSGKPDYALAAHWFRKAAEYGVHDSQYNLAILLARGLGVQQNLTLSYAWFAVAAAHGDADAGKKRDDVGARLHATDLAAAKATAEAFRPKTPDPAANVVTPPPGGWSAPAADARKMARPKLSRS